MVGRVCAAIAFGTWSLVALAGSSLAQPGLADPHRGQGLVIDRQASSPTRVDVPAFAELWGVGEMPSGMRKGRPVVPIVDAEDVGDARRGAAYAQKSCSSCHNVSASDAASPNRQAPGFKKIANTPGMTVTALTVWSRTSHPTMPNFVIDPRDMDDLIAYILSLKDGK